MTSPTVDAIVIGAGHNGLTAAAYLARAGLAVTALERRDVTGGACVTEELWPGVRASPGAYTLSLLRPEIMRELDLARHGLEVAVHEPYLFAPQPTVARWSPGPPPRGRAKDSRPTGHLRTRVPTPPSPSVGNAPRRRRAR